MTVAKKMIRIPHNGPIYPKGGVSGPITTPYMEDTRTIFIMITRNIRVVEVLSDKSEIELTVMNFDADHTKPAVKEEEVPPVTDKTPPVTDAVPPVNNNTGGNTHNSNKHGGNGNKADILQKK